jgi:hypothetical protein
MSSAQLFLEPTQPNISVTPLDIQVLASVFLEQSAFFITNWRRIIAPRYERIGLFIIRYG